MGSRCHSVEHVEDLRARGASLDHSVCGCVCVSLSVKESLLVRGNTPHERLPGCVSIWPWGEWGLDEGKKEKNERKGQLWCAETPGWSAGRGGDICFGQPSQPISAHRYVVCEGSSSTLSLFLSSHQNLSIALSHTNTFSPC